jgi:hypothetical protein
MKPLVRCAWHPKFNNGETLIMQDGDPLQVSDGLCPSCEAVMMREVQACEAVMMREVQELRVKR